MLQNKTLTYISLFSSAGIGCYGFKEAGFECIATNEIIERRLNIQRLNQKCIFESGYIHGDIKKQVTKDKIFEQIDLYKKKFGNDRVDVLVATPPCQGMSVANHKKNQNEIDRNSLVVESVELIGKIKPRFFILENVSSFYKTGCIDRNKNLIEIGTMIEQNLSQEYSIYNDIINFKNYGANSSRTRTIVIGVCKELKDFIASIELFPNFCNERSLKSILSKQKSLQWGEYDKNDFYHSFRLYPLHMREWIKDLKEGQSAFDNKDNEKKPHKIVNGQIIFNTNKNGDKYKRQRWDSVAPCIHTRNDQLASQNTIHPNDDRVFSIRELMLMMNIPNNFKWLPYTLQELNTMPYKEKQKISKQNEMNIRQSIGEAVPTIIFKQIADKISTFMKKQNFNSKIMLEIINKYNLQDFNNLKIFIANHLNNLSTATLSNLAEFTNAKREQNSAYFTNKFIINEIAKELPNFTKDSITIIEPSAGCGNFLPIIFKKYKHIKQVILKVIDINQNSLDILKMLYENQIPKNFKLEFICMDFMKFNNKDKIDLIVGNPPFSKIKQEDMVLSSFSENLSNLAGFFLEKSLQIADFVSMIMPKNLLNTKEYEQTRYKLQNKGVKSIIDFGELGFNSVLIETINITTGKTKEVSIRSLPLNLKLLQKQSYIFDNKLPYWVIYRNPFFDKVFKSMNLGIFDSFRDRQLTNTNTTTTKNNESIRVVKSRNIDNNGNIIEINGYDSYITKDNLYKFKISEFLNRDDVYLTPNMTYNPRISKKEKGFVVNGSVAILIPKQNITLTQNQQNYISSDEFRNFYRIARNYQTRTLNIDNISCFWFGALKDS
ncbi:DNA cytosine methyltransferase [Campylobacter insulaenigrae]|uniref:DNA (cytosine-5-)-methyltransferase n=1 Tax=Campylobacter insulaenigrae NCTC 12927 TaxID=1031564 RepID=A0A0A8GZV6_9BACT|nr:DNA cytosine methyltransferase [Campylobacter insulaenigrae]AJC87055.1 cytosine-specific DNA methyltransferase [Campylobacter insulaenigrae NCTC 12927]MCR6575190.1 DNA cytosine methyltransferase [Campylobacter insulaenigrae]VEH92594.1 modification methylase [Campylobacter insulaenigrae]